MTSLCGAPKLPVLSLTKMNRPLEISHLEWAEIMALPMVRENWGLTDETPDDFASSVYGVKFNFFSGSPGYVGDLYIIQGNVLSGDPPLLIGRHNGALRRIYE